MNEANPTPQETREAQIQAKAYELMQEAEARRRRQPAAKRKPLAPWSDFLAKAETELFPVTAQASPQAVETTPEAAPETQPTA